jgi:hypothetical protein
MRSRPTKCSAPQRLIALRHAANRVVLDGESYRVPRPMPESTKSALAKGGKNKDS